jgi:hypothetical protein
MPMGRFWGLEESQRECVHMQYALLGLEFSRRIDGQ